MYTATDLEQARARLAALEKWYESHSGISRARYRNDVKQARLWVQVVEADLRAHGVTETMDPDSNRVEQPEA